MGHKNTHKLMNHVRLFFNRLCSTNNVPLPRLNMACPTLMNIANKLLVTFKLEILMVY